MDGRPWRVQLLGAFKVENGGVAAAFRTRKTSGLLAYLAYYAGRPISKELLSDALWPESDTEKARQSLRMAVSSIRSTLARPDWDPLRHVMSDRDTLEVSDHGFVTDVAEFRDHLAAAHGAAGTPGESAQLAQAVQLYGGPLLPGLADEWILPQALELEEAYAQAVCRLVHLTAASGDLPAAVSIARKAIAICPTREDLHVALMRAYAKAGQAASALKQYEELERMLDEQWGEMPGDEARATLEALPRQGEDSAVIAVTDFAKPAASGVERAFFGREKELADLQNLLDPRTDMQHLVTLFGLGGTGKTRLAQQVVAQMHDAFGGRTWFVSLVGVEEPAQIHEALLTALVQSPPKNLDVLDAVAGSIGRAPALLVFDNLEHILDPARTVVEFLLEKCPSLRVLATSRIPLDTPTERLVPLAPLPLPSDYRDLTALRASPSVQLLVEAAQAVRPGFAVTPANGQSVLLLCRRLDGIPLAIELAAAKLATLSPAQVLASIARSGDLSTERSSIPERHRSLETVLAWSLALLTEKDREAFASLSVCRGGLNSELGRDLLGEDAEHHLLKLCHCALLGWHEAAEEVRFEMLETVREMATRLLIANPSRAEESVRQHFAYVHRLTTSFYSLQTEEERAHWVARVAADTGNVLAAIEAGSTGNIDAEKAWEMTLPLEHFIRRRGRSQIWIGPLESLLNATRLHIAPATVARAHSLLAEAHYGLRAIRNTFDHSYAAIEAADKAGDPMLRIDVRVEFTTPAITLGEFERAEQVLQDAIGLLPKANDPKLGARCYLNLAWVLFDRGDEPESEPIFQKARELAELSGDTSTIGSALTGLASAIGHSRYTEGLLLYDTAVGLWTAAGMPGYLAHCLYNRSMIDYRHGRLDEALANISKAFRIYVGNDIALGQTILTVSGNLMAALGRHEQAAACWGRAEAARQRYGMRMIPTVAQDFDREIVIVRAAMSPSALQTAFDHFRAVSDQELAELLFGRQTLTVGERS